METAPRGQHLSTLRGILASIRWHCKDLPEKNALAYFVGSSVTKTKVLNFGTRFELVFLLQGQMQQEVENFKNIYIAFVYGKVKSFAEVTMLWLLIYM